MLELNESLIIDTGNGISLVRQRQYEATKLDNYCQSHMNCFKNSVATSLPRVLTDSFNSLISLSMS
jgi:hypothetical protein